MLLMCIVSSCVKYDKKYPKYSLEELSYVPDSLKEKHRGWVKETIRASNQHLSAGDYEDIDETIIQVKNTADELFEVRCIGLRKQINEHTYDDLILFPDKLNTYETRILDSLLNDH
jgi:inorganic pyrophosphatase